MKSQKSWPEIYVEKDFLTSRDDVVKGVVKVDEDTFKVFLDHPVFGRTMELFEVVDTNEEGELLCLKSSYPADMQSEEEMEVVKDYYNNFILEGQQTYLEYYAKELGGYFLLSRNIHTVDGSVWTNFNEQ